MGLNETPKGERIHIGIFGRTNSGKSSIINAVTGQGISIVSEISGTTTDPVEKTMELLPLGPVVLIDTAGLDDTSELGQKRMERTNKVLNRTDLALIVLEAGAGRTDEDERIIDLIRKRNIPHILVYNKVDLASETVRERLKEESEKNTITVSSNTLENIHELKELMASLMQTGQKQKRLLGDLIAPKDLIILVIPVDSAAPKGRLILPQQQVIRDILDSRAQALMVQVEELKEALESLNRKPSLVITDSQAFNEVKRIVPEDIPLTSFSILLARYKGNLKEAVRGASALDELKENSRILISEGCTHHKQCDDIGTVKLPRWIRSYTGKEFVFEHSNGMEFHGDKGKYDLVIHCGGCMLNEKEMQSRINSTLGTGTPITNYGILIAHMNGILERSIRPLRDL